MRLPNLLMSFVFSGFSVGRHLISERSRWRNHSGLQDVSYVSNSSHWAKQMKKLITLAFLLGFSGLHAATLVIDDFSFAQAVGSGSSGGSISETDDASIFGGYRRILANGFNSFVIVGDRIEAGDSSGISSISILGGALSISKSAFTGSAFASYNGRAHTSGDRIGNLSLDISGGANSLASPILFLSYTAMQSDQVVTLSLSSGIGDSASYDIPLAAGTSEISLDLLQFAPVRSTVPGGVDFRNIEDILLGFGARNPVGEVQITRFAFVPEVSSMLLLSSGFTVLLSRRRRNKESEQEAVSREVA